MAAPSPTAKLYLDDPYTTVFDAEVVACQHVRGDRCQVVLDKTYFYPESGGQLADRGTIGGVEIIDVQEDENGSVHHYTIGEIELGTQHCEIDWDRRFRHMQHHTGQHVLSRAFIEVAGLQTASFHMGDESCTIDLDGGAISDDIMDLAEALAGDIVFENRSVSVRTMARDELDDEALRRKIPDGADAVRLVGIDGFDVCGCCGTHVRNTGELGVIKVLKFEKAKTYHRVTFKVGHRALDDFRVKHEIVKYLAGKFTTGVDEVADKVDKLQAESRQCRKEIKQLSQRLAELEADRLLAEADEHDGRRYVVHVFDDRGDEFVRTLGALLKGAANTVSLLATTGGAIVCNVSADLDIDLQGAVTNRAREAGGSGGGKGGFASVRLPEGADVAGFLDAALEAIKQA